MLGSVGFERRLSLDQGTKSATASVMSDRGHEREPHEVIGFGAGEATEIRQRKNV
jgi:hypothetical protein